ncbi:MAG TPA: hypothetical protein VEB21_18895, partial [Terriglobales bacterium]|nr:hypothetical protein [Terriglobales bacterium]
HDNPKAMSNWIMSELLRVVNDRHLDAALTIREWPVAAERLAELVRMIDGGQISGKIAKTVFAEMVANGGNPAEIVAAQGLVQISDEGPIVAAVEAVLQEHASKAEEYRQGKEKLFGFFVGQVMRATQGKANPELVNKILKDKLS